MKVKHRKIGGFLVILIGSSILWFVSKYKDVYEDRATISVVWKDVPNDIILQEKGTIITFRGQIKDRGFSLLWRKIYSHQVELDFNRFTFKRNDSIFFNPAKVLDDLNDVQREVNVVTASNNDVLVPVSRVEKKRVALVKDFKVSYSANFQPVKLKGFNPDTVRIYGDKKDLDLVNSLKVTSLPVTINDTVTVLKFKLADQFKHLLFDVEIVEYIIIAAEMTEGTVTIPIELINVPSKANVKLLPELLTITYTTTLKDFNDVRALDFKVTIDYDLIDSNNASVVPNVQLGSDKIKGIRLNDKVVQVLSIL
jgi:hypothetical protein